MKTQEGDSKAKETQEADSKAEETLKDVFAAERDC